MLVIVSCAATATPRASAANLTERVPLSIDRSDRPAMDAEWDELSGLIRLNATSTVATDLTGQKILGQMVDPAPVAGDACARAGALAVGDINSDGRPDAVLGCAGDNSSRGNVLVFTKNSGAGYSHDSTIIDSAPVVGDQCGYSVAVADINADSRADVIFSCRVDNGSRGNIQVFTKNAGAGFTHDSTLTDPAAVAGDQCGVSLAVTDINADARPDVITGCAGDNGGRGNVLVFTKNAGVGFTHDSTLTDPAAAAGDVCGYSVTAGDANGDTRPDIAIGCYGDNGFRGNVLLFTKNSGAGFTHDSTVVDPAAAANDQCGSSVGLGDFDADGRADLIMGCQGDSSAGANAGLAVTFTKDVGAGFTHHASLTGPAAGSSTLLCGTSVALVDMNADGRRDALIGCGYGYNPGATIYTKNAGSGFTYNANSRDTTTAATGCGTSFATSDLDSNGTVDVLVGCQYGMFAGKAVAVAMPTTPQVLVNPSPGSMDMCGYSVATGDINGDGLADAVVSCLYLNFPSPPFGGALVFLKNAGAGFTYDATLSPGAGMVCNSVGVADLNGDGRSDVIQTCSTGEVLVRLRTAGGAFTSETISAGANCFAPPASADFDGNGRMDIAIGCPDVGGGTVRVLTKNRGSGYALTNSLIDPSGVYGDNCATSLAVGDINDDRRPDLIAGCPGDNSSAGSALVFTKNSGAGFTLDTTLVDPAPASDDMCGQSVAFGDVDADGLSDAVVGCRGNASDEGNALVFTKNVGAGFTHDATLVDAEPSPSIAGGCGTAVATGDTNADGRADVLVGCSMRNLTGGSLLFRRNSGSGFSLDATVQIPRTVAGTCGTSVALGDFDADGRADQITGCPQSESSNGMAVFGQSVAPTTFPVSRTVQTRRLNAYGGTVLTATITVGSVLNSGSISAMHASADGGATWEAITNGALHTFTATGTDLRLRATIASNVGNTQTPLIHALTVNYTTLNNAPTTTLVSPADAASTSDTTPDLTATYVDADSVDTGTIEFEVCTVTMSAGQSCVGAGGSVLASGSSAAGLDPGTNGTWTSSALPAPQTMHWHARSIDDSAGTGAWTASRSITTTVTNTLTGTVSDTSMCDGSTPVVGIAINSVKWSTRPCAPGTGAWTAWPSWSVNDTVTIYYDDVPMHGTAYLHMPTASSTPISGIIVRSGIVSTHANPGNPVTEADIDRWDGDNDADILARYPVSSNVDIDDSMLLLVAGGWFAPSVTVEASRVRVLSGATYVAGSSRLHLRGSGSQTCASITTDNPFCIDAGGTFSAGTGTVSYRPSGASVVPGATYYNLEVVSSSTATVQLGASGAPNITAQGSVLLDGTGGAPTFSTSTYSPVLNVTGSMTVDGTATLAGSGAGTWLLYGDVGGTGNVDLTAGNVVLVPNADRTLHPSGTLPGTSWKFAILSLYNGSAVDRAITIPSTARAIEARTGLAVTAAWTGALTVDATNTTQPISVRSFQSTGNATVLAPPQLNVAENFYSTGTFTPNNGTVSFDGTGTSSGILFTGSGSFYDVSIEEPDATVTLLSDITVTHGLTATGSSCAHPVSLDSDSAGSQRTIANGGATTAITFASLQDIAFTNPVTATHTVDLGNNANVTFTGSTCVATVTGYTSDPSMCDGVTPVVGIAINSTKWGVVPCAPVSGTFSAEPTFAAGDVITMYFDGIAATGTTYVRTLTGSGGPVVNYILVPDVVVVASLDPGTPITVSDVDRWDGDDDPDIGAQYPVSSGLLIEDGTKFIVGEGTFAPGADVRVERIWIMLTGSYDAGSTTLAIRGSGTQNCVSLASDAPACGMGDFAAGTGTVRFAPTATSVISGGTYHALEIVGSTTTTITMGSVDDPAITAASVLIDGTAGAPEIVASNSVSIAGPLTVNGSAKLTMPTPTSFQVSGDLTGTGDIDLTGGMLTMLVASDVQINPSGTLPGTPWNLGMLQVTNADSAAHTVTIPATARGITASYVATDATAGDLTIDASAMTQPLRPSALVIASDVTFQAPPQLILDMGMSMDGTFLPGSGAVSFTGTGAGIIMGTGITAFHDLTVATTGKSLTIQGAVHVSHALTVVGDSCASPSALTSMDPGVQQTVNTTGATVDLHATVIQDIAFATPLLARGAQDGGNNANLTATAEACAPTVTHFTDNTDASGGSAGATSIDGTSTFHHSFINTSGVDADRYRAEVTTTVLGPLVRGLWALDGNGADRSGTDQEAVASGGGPAWVGGAPNFGQAAEFDGVDDVLTAPSSSDYNVSEFTVDLWMRAPSLSPGAAATLVSRADSSTDAQFAIWTDSAQGQLHASVSAGGTFYDVSTPAAPVLDDTWHHVAMTVDASRTIRLYVDGVELGSGIYAGTLDMPAAPIRIGSAGSAGTYFDGMIDDVHFYSEVVPAGGVRGYANTARPHAQSIWQSPNASTIGEALPSTCATGTRCDDITYGGADIHLEGARYYFMSSVRTTNGFWSYNAGDWFETADAISVVAPASVALPDALPEEDVTASFAVTSVCAGALGCEIQLSSASNTAALATSMSADHIPPITPAAPAAPALWAAGAPLGLGVTVLSSTSGKDTGRWGSGSDFSDLADLRFVGPTRTGTLLHDRGTSGSETTSVGVRLNAPTSTSAGAYWGRLSVVAVPGV